MSIYTLREMLEIAPELADHVKQASDLDDFSTNSKEDTLVSSLKATYLVKIAKKVVCPETLTKVATATRLYGLEDQVKELTDLLVAGNLEKAASVPFYFTHDLRLAESYIEAETSGFCDIEKVAEAAQELFDSYPDDVESELVRTYAGANVFVKAAAVEALKARARIVPMFEKMAHIVEATDASSLTQSQVRTISQVVTQMDKEAGLCTKGFNFYKEAFLTKEAASSSLLVNCAGKKVGIEKLMRANIGDILGNDVAAHLGTDPYEMKAAIEALPRDSQQLLARYL